MRTYRPAPLPLAPPPPAATPANSTSDVHGILHLAPSPDDVHLATVPANAPTTVWITALLPEARTVAVLVHHAPIKALEWCPRPPFLILIQCTTASSSSAEPSPSSYPLYLWQSTRPTEPVVLSASISTGIPPSKFGQAGPAASCSATWLSPAPGEDDDKQFLVSGPGACTVITGNEDLAESDPKFREQNAQLNEVAEKTLTDEHGAARSMGAGEVDDTFAFRKRQDG